MSDMTGSILGIGNSFWGMTNSLSQIAQSFCFGTGAGAAINSLTAEIWHFISQGAVVGLLAVIGLIMVIFRLRKGGRFGELIRFAFIIVLMAGIGYQSSKPPSASGNYPPLSPAWLVQTTFSTTETLVSAPLSALVSTTTGTYKNASIGQSSSAHVGISCASYEQSLLNSYQKATGNTPLEQSTAVVPEIISNIWDNSGLAADGIAQFGNNPYAATTACHLYDSKAGIASVNQAQDVMNALAANGSGGGLHYGSPGGPLIKPNHQALAFPAPNSSAQTLNESLIGWAACVKPGSDVLAAQPGFFGANSTIGQSTPTVGDVKAGIYPSKTTTSPTGLSNANCKAWWSQPGVGWAGSSAFNIPNSRSFITGIFKNNPQTASFMLQMDGFGQGGTNLFVSVAYLISSFVVLIIFGVLDLAVIIAKFGILIMMVLLLFFLLVDVLPSARKGHTMKFVKQFMGFLVLAVGAEAVLGLVALLTSVIDTFGSGIIHGSGMSMLWVSISPIAAILGLHKLFKTLKVPSPFRVDSAMAYAGALGGGAVIGGAMFSKLNNRVTGRGKALARKHSKKLIPGGGARAYGPKGSGGERIGDGKTMPPKKTRTSVRSRPGVNTTGARTNTAATANARTNTTAGAGASAHSAMPNGRATTTAGVPSNHNGGQAADATTTTAEEKKPLSTLRPPEAMRLEGAEKLRDKRKLHRDAKKLSKSVYGSTPAARLKTKTVMRGKLAIARARAHPVKTASKALGYGAVGAIGAFTAPVGLPLTVAALGVHYGIGKARQAKRERPYRKAERKAHLSAMEREVKKLDRDGIDWRSEIKRQKRQKRTS
jgi:hypothetical protein